MYCKEYYEKLIDDSRLFSIDKVTERSLYNRESLKIIENLYCYLMAINERKYERFGVEICEVAKTCIKNYDPSLGRFLNYFMRAWSREYRHLYSDERIESDFGSMAITERQKRIYVKYKMDCNRLGVDSAVCGLDQMFAEELNMSDEQIRDLIILDESKTISIDDVFDDGDSESKKQYASDDDFVSLLENRESAEEFLKIIENVYIGLQERQKPLISVMLTSKLTFEISDDKLYGIFSRMNYFVLDIYNECSHNGEPLLYKEIAQRFGVKESSISRTWAVFSDKVKNTML